MGKTFNYNSKQELYVLNAKYPKNILGHSAQLELKKSSFNRSVIYIDKTQVN